MSSKDPIWATSEGHDRPKAQAYCFPTGFRLSSSQTLLQELHVLSSGDHFKHTIVLEKEKCSVALSHWFAWLFY